MARHNRDGVEKELTTLRAAVLSIAAFLVGLALIFFSNMFQMEPLKTFIRELGSLLAIPAFVTLLWELWVRRAFLNEIWALADLGQELKTAGLVGFADNFQTVAFHSLLQNARSLDIFFAYGSTWRNWYAKELTDIARTEGASIRIVLPDPEDDQVVGELSRRFHQDPDRLRTRITDAKDFFLTTLRRRAGENGANIAVWYLPLAPHHSFYIMDNKAVIAMYNHREGRDMPVPTFVARKGGLLFNFAHDQMQDMVRKEDGLARRVEE